MHNALGIHIFAGGFTHGVKRHFNVVGQLEDGKFGHETTQANHPGLPQALVFDQWKAKADELIAARGPIDFIYSNPPCAPWSVAGHSWKNSRKAEAKWHERDPRTSCVYQTFAMLEHVRPKVWAWESVCPAWTKGREMIDQLTVRAAQLGYSASYVFLQATDIGVAQRRKRLFVLFHNVAFKRWYYPRREKPKTVREAWTEAFGDTHSNDDHYPTNENVLRILRYTKPGTGLRSGWEEYMAVNNLTPELNDRGHTKGRPAFSMLRLSLDREAPTMIGGAHMFHPYLDRPITVKEAQVLCSYPPTYEFKGRVGDRHCQMARAVMPDVGAWLALNVNRALDDAEPTSGKRFYVNHADNKYEDITPVKITEEML